METGRCLSDGWKLIVPNLCCHRTFPGWDLHAWHAIHMLTRGILLLLTWHQGTVGTGSQNYCGKPWPEGKFGGTE